MHVSTGTWLARAIHACELGLVQVIYRSCIFLLCKLQQLHQHFRCILANNDISMTNEWQCLSFLFRIKLPSSQILARDLFWQLAVLCKVWWCSSKNAGFLDLLILVAAPQTSFIFISHILLLAAQAFKRGSARASRHILECFVAIFQPPRKLGANHFHHISNHRFPVWGKTPWSRGFPDSGSSWFSWLSAPGTCASDRHPMRGNPLSMSWKDGMTRHWCISYEECSTS